jgi:hypothetical protein
MVALNARFHQTADHLSEMYLARCRQLGTFLRYVHLLAVHDFSYVDGYSTGMLLTLQLPDLLT